MACSICSSNKVCTLFSGFLLVGATFLNCVLLSDLWCYETLKIVPSKLSLIADGNIVAGDSNMGSGTWSTSF